MRFRKDIGFLRALAVAAVMFYHFQVPGFAGGFAGVDIFFVISGFLMTGLVTDKLPGHRFSLLGFYAARARRIIPPLLVLCLALMLFGYVYLPLPEYREYLRTLKSALLFTSNITFSETAGYFAAPLKDNWLLHTWSLSVEWQFYLIYPIVLMALNHFGRTMLRPGLLILLVFSLVASVVLTVKDPTYAFYLLPARAWEMLAGGLVYLSPLSLSRGRSLAVQVAGLALIAGAIVWLDSGDMWPGYLAVLPVAGTMLVLGACRSTWLTDNTALQYLGRISYSTYLWHWPLVVLLYTCGLLREPVYVVGGLLTAVICGALSWRWIEARQKAPRGSASTLTRYAVMTAVIVGLSATLASVFKDYPQLRFAFKAPVPPQYTTELFPRECYDNSYGAAECKFGEGEVSVILLGDSHAEATAAAVQLQNPGASLSWSKGGCPTLERFEARDKHQEQLCKAFNQDKLTRLEQQYQGVPVVLFSRAALYTDIDRSNEHYVISAGGVNQQRSHGVSYRDEYARTVCDIAVHHPVTIVKPIPEMPFNIYKGLYLQHAIFGRSGDIGAPLEDYYQRNRVALAAIEQAARQCAVQVVDPVPVLCSDGQCAGSRNGVALYFDDNHLVDAGNRILAPIFAPVFSQKSVAQVK